MKNIFLDIVSFLKIGEDILVHFVLNKLLISLPWWKI